MAPASKGEERQVVARRARRQRRHLWRRRSHRHRDRHRAGPPRRRHRPRALLDDGGVTNPPTGGPAVINRPRHQRQPLVRRGERRLAQAVRRWHGRTVPRDQPRPCVRQPARRAPAPNNGVLAPNTDRVVSVKDGRDGGGAVTTADVVPAGATAVAINVTVSGPTGPNFLSVVPGDVRSFTASTINWPGGFRRRQRLDRQARRHPSAQGVLRRSVRQHSRHHRRDRLLPRQTCRAGPPDAWWCRPQ